MMNDDEIEKISEPFWNHHFGYSEIDTNGFARAIAAKEREACAAIVDAEMEENAWESNASVVLNNVAAEIRARAWSDVPDATKWVDELRGDEPQPIGEIRLEHLDAPYKASQVVMHFYNELPPVGTKLYTAIAKAKGE